jgi:hypothetical protein
MDRERAALLERALDVDRGSACVEPDVGRKRAADELQLLGDDAGDVDRHALALLAAAVGQSARRANGRATRR